MCLLITQPAGTQWSKEWIEDFHSYNPDGVGVMWAENGHVHVEKILPKTASDVVKFLEKHQGRECAIHYRWATHGDVDLNNCHPYELLGEETGHPMFLMHNGILSQGNALDKTKSDTHQFIRTHLRPLLDPTVGGNPDLMFQPAFIEMLGSFIGSSNKFVVVDYKGRMATVNESAFVDFNGAKLSNTYAWSAPGKSRFGKRSGSPLQSGVLGTGLYNNHWGNEYEDYYGGEGWAEPVGSAPRTTVAKGMFIGDDDEEPEVISDDDKAYEEAEIEAQMIYSEFEYMDLELATKEISLAELTNIIYFHGDADEVYAAVDNLYNDTLTEKEFIAQVKVWVREVQHACSSNPGFQFPESDDDGEVAEEVVEVSTPITIN